MGTRAITIKLSRSKKVVLIIDEFGNIFSVNADYLMAFISGVRKNTFMRAQYMGITNPVNFHTEESFEYYKSIVGNIYKDHNLSKASLKKGSEGMVQIDGDEY